MNSVSEGERERKTLVMQKLLHHHLYDLPHIFINVENVEHEHFFLNKKKSNFIYGMRERERERERERPYSRDVL